jgi:RNA polymerase sigma-70 factor (ECF subfamily)
MAGVVTTTLLGAEGAMAGNGADERAAPNAQGLPADVRGRVTAAVREHRDFVYRLLRRLGVPEANAEDALQRVYLVLARRIDTVLVGGEKAYLFGIALRVARATRSSMGASRETADEDALARAPAPARGVDEQLDDRRARALLDELLDAMPLELKTVFVLHELEQLTMVEIAAMLELPQGTVASRLRRSREEFQRLSSRLQARLAAAGPAAAKETKR